MDWVWFGLVLAAIALAPVVVNEVRVYHRSRRGGVLRLDTPHGRSALRRCNPARGEVTYPLRPVEKRGGFQPTAFGPPPTEPPPKPRVVPEVLERQVERPTGPDPDLKNIIKTGGDL